MYTKKLYTPLRYPGGKARFALFIASVMQFNGLDGGHYMEPYAGGAGVALELLFDGVVTDVHINDADPAIYAFWNAATAHSDALIKLVETEAINIDAWMHWRGVMRGETAATDVERGFATLFMNRTNRSGILKAGVIGGKNQSGAYKLDARFKREVLIGRLRRIADRARGIHVYCRDALELLQHATELIPANSLIYLDPPYYVKGSGLYRNFYQHADHLAIAQLLQKQDFERRWVVSYDDAEPIHEMYHGVRSIQYGLGYTAQRRYTGAEVMLFDPHLNLGDFLSDRKVA